MTRLLPAFTILAIVLIACVPETGSATPIPTPAAPSPASTAVSSAAPSLEPSEPPDAASPEPTDSATPTPPPASTDPSESAEAGSGVEACSGTDDNRDFFAGASSALAWPVYCASLPQGWFVQTGEYRLRNGGFLAITYKGPGGALLELQQGAICGSVEDCAPEGDELGDASFGNRNGTLVDLGDGRLAVVVDPGAAVSWIATGTGIEESLFRELTGDLVEVSD